MAILSLCIRDFSADPIPVTDFNSRAAAHARARPCGWAGDNPPPLAAPAEKPRDHPTGS